MTTKKYIRYLLLKYHKDLYDANRKNQTRKIINLIDVVDINR